jgi:hypothetical protein
MFGIPNAWRTWTRIVVPVEKNWHPTDGPRPRGAKAVIDESTAARLSAVVGDGEFSEFAGAAHGAPEGPATTTAALIRRNTPAAAIAVATLACLWVGIRMNQSLPDTVAHAGADGGSFGEPTAAAGPMFGAGRDPGARGGDPAMNLKNSARVAVLAVTAAVTANGALAGDAVQWRVEDGGNGHWYRAVDAATGDSAIVLAASLGGNLATIANAGENAIVKQVFLATGKQYAWIGLLQASGQATPGAGWYWVTGEPLKYLNWTDHNGAFPTSAPDDSPCAISPWGVENDQANQGVMDPTGRWDDLENGMPTCGSPVWNNAAIVEWSADCNNDNIVDYGQILNGTLADTNTNNIPDCCEPGNSCCLGDIYVNHIVDGGDLGVLLSEWGVVTPTTRSDLNRDGFVDGADLGRLLANWGPCGG